MPDFEAADVAEGTEPDSIAVFEAESTTAVS